MPSNITAAPRAVGTTALPHDGAVAWGEFVRRHGPAVYAAGRRNGLADADAAELACDVLRFFAGGIGATHSAPETVRGWVQGVTRERLRDFHAPRRTHLTSGPPADQDADWERDYGRRSASWAMESVRHEFDDDTWEAFWGTAVEGDPADRVANRLGTSAGAVWVARCRVLARLSEAVEAIRSGGEHRVGSPLTTAHAQ